MKIYVEQEREKQGLTQSELARKSGVAKSHINGIERGESNPTINILCKIANALNIPCEKLYSCDGK